MREEIEFPGQREGEEMILFLRRHWFIFFMRLLFIFVSIAVLVAAYYVFAFLNANFQQSVYYNLFLLAESLGTLFVWNTFFILWLDYYLDVWIVTNERIINIEQHGFFSRKVSELKLTKIQDVTSEIIGVIPSLLNYGNIYVQTAGEMHWQTENSFIFWWPIYSNAATGNDEALFFEMEDEPPARELIGYAALVISKQSFSAGVRQILVNTGAIVVIFLSLGIAMSFVVVRRMTRPLSTILKKVKENTGGAGVGDDLSLLSETYGGMLQELERSFETIKELKDGLEVKVAERTKELSDRQLQLESANLKLSQTLVKLQEAQQQLIQSEKMAAMGQMVAGVAHEINNSVNFISGALPSVKRLLGDLKELLASYEELEQVRDADDRDRNIAAIRSLKNDLDFAGLFATFEQLLANIEEGTTRTTRIIKDLKIFTRQGAEKFQPADIHSIIDSTIPFIDGKLLKGIEIRKEFDKLEPVTCLAGRISQVFLNIMQNAAQAMSGKGTLTIRTWQEDGQAHVRFTDTGCGIEQDIIHRIFDPFFTTKEVGRGSGLGLGISYDIIKQHSGRINVESKIGQGTVFEVILPLSPPIFPAEREG